MLIWLIVSSQLALMIDHNKSSPHQQKPFSLIKQLQVLLNSKLLYYDHFAAQGRRAKSEHELRREVKIPFRKEAAPDGPTFLVLPSPPQSLAIC